MTKATKTKRQTKNEGPNYLIIGKGRTIFVVSGATREISPLDKATSDDVLNLVRERQQLGQKLKKLLTSKGFALADKGVIDLEAGS
jgi:hypothetical protein